MYRRDVASALICYGDAIADFRASLWLHCKISGICRVAAVSALASFAARF